MSVLTKSLIIKSEETAAKNGTFSLKELMFTAGTKAAEYITENFNLNEKRIAVICGKGNNGGDGCVIAEHLFKMNFDVTLITPFGKPVTENAKYYCSVSTCPKSDFFTPNYDIIIDAIFGIGFEREPDFTTKALFSEINKSSATKISIDIPSGVVCDSGKVWEEAIKADTTLTFIALKPCFMLPFGSDYCGNVVVLDIGVPIIDKEYNIIKKPLFEKRLHNSHKGTFGTALLICGSYGMAGAAMLAAKSALRSGLGIVKNVLPKSIYYPFTTFLPEAVCLPLEEDSLGKLNIEISVIKKDLENSDAVLCGPGLGKSENIKKLICEIIRTSKNPIVIDADGINAIADCIEILKESKAPIIITPHPGEMARLCKTTSKEIESNRVYYARKIASDYDCIVVLKGSNTIVTDKSGEISFNIIGNSGMATGGCGDVLSGIIVSLCAQGITPITAAKYAVYLHSAAADKAAQKRNTHSIIPTDIIEEL